MSYCTQSKQQIKPQLQWKSHTASFHIKYKVFLSEIPFKLIFFLKITITKPFGFGTKLLNIFLCFCHKQRENDIYVWGGNSWCSLCMCRCFSPLAYFPSLPTAYFIDHFDLDLCFVVYIFHILFSTHRIRFFLQMITTMTASVMRKPKADDTHANRKKCVDSNSESNEFRVSQVTDVEHHLSL